MEVQEKIHFADIETAGKIAGALDENFKFLESELGVTIAARGQEVMITGAAENVKKAQETINYLLLLAKKQEITKADVSCALGRDDAMDEKALAEVLSEVFWTTSRAKQIRAKTIGQYHYLKTIEKKDITFAIGPAGTGKTYLAVVMAVKMLKNKKVERIILTRPAVEAGEKLGFLPGDLQDKVDPYLRPLYDGLYDVLGADTAQKYLEREIIEIAPLAYMRGRTLDNAFIILDEAQNTTNEQMKMFLTRIGFGSKAVITGDITQIDLPKNTTSGLLEAERVLSGIGEIGFNHLSALDVVRHPVVAKIIKAYEHCNL